MPSTDISCGAVDQTLGLRPRDWSIIETAMQCIRQANHEVANGTFASHLHLCCSLHFGCLAIVGKHSGQASREGRGLKECDSGLCA